MQPLTIVTTNSAKFDHLSAGLQQLGIASRRFDYDLTEIQSLDQHEVIAAKAKAAFAVIAAPVLVDDAGFYFTHYRDFPGVYSKFMFQALGYDGLFRLVRDGDPIEARLSLGYLDVNLATPQVFSGVLKGHITTDFVRPTQPVMPYAPMMLPIGFDQSLDQLRADPRLVDHRQQALQAFAKWFLKNRG